MLPDGADGYRAALSVCSGLPLRASSTLTLVELAQATNSVLPSGVSTISVGCRSVVYVPTSACLLHVDDGDRGLAPQADEEAFAIGGGQAGIGVGIGAGVDPGGRIGDVERHDGDGVAPGAGDE